MPKPLRGRIDKSYRDPDTNCCIYWLKGDSGGNKQHRSFAAEVAGYFSTPNRELWVKPPLSEGVTYDLGRPYPKPYHVYELKTGHRFYRYPESDWPHRFPTSNWPLTPWRSKDWVDYSLQKLKNEKQFRKQQRAADECKLRFQIYFEEMKPTWPKHHPGYNVSPPPKLEYFLPGTTV